MVIFRRGGDACGAVGVCSEPDGTWGRWRSVAVVGRDKARRVCAWRGVSTGCGDHVLVGVASLST